MTRNNKRKQAKRKSKGGGFDSITRVPVQDYLNGSFVSGQHQQSLHPAELSSGSTSVGLIASAFEFYRITKLRYRLHPNGGGTDVAAAYIAGVTDNPPNTTYAMASVGTHVLLSDDTSVPTRWRSISKQELSSYSTWYKTALGTPDPAQEVQGVIFLTQTTGTDQFKLEMDAVYEFKSLVPLGATPRERGLKECQAERDRLLRLIQTPSLSSFLGSGIPVNALGALPAARQQTVPVPAPARSHGPP